MVYTEDVMVLCEGTDDGVKQALGVGGMNKMIVSVGK